MKVLEDMPAEEKLVRRVVPARIQLPWGLVGLREYTRAELFHLPEQLPLRWLRLVGAPPLDFVVVEPVGLIADYVPELFDEDAAAIGLESADDALVLNIVTVCRGEPVTATVNLVGPIVVNWKTKIGRQVILSNHARFDARHPLLGATG